MDISSANFDESSESASAPEDDMSKMTVTEKMSLFRQKLDDRVKKDNEEVKETAAAASGGSRSKSPVQYVKRFQDRKRLERAQTQPILGRAFFSIVISIIVKQDANDKNFNRESWFR